MGNAYDSASLLVTPNGYKASKIYSAKPTDGSGDLAFSRASTAMRRNSAGLWESVANNVPRLQYPVGGGCPSWLFEPQATNYALQSTDFSNVAWVKTGVTVTPNFSTSVLLGVNASKLTFTTIGTINTTQSFLGNSSIAAWVMVKADTLTKFRLVEAFYFGNFVEFDLVAKTATGTGGFIIEQDNGWFICGLTKSYGVGQTNLSYTLNSISTAGSLLICQAQFEVGSVATSPIITAGSTVTRLADVSNTTGLSAVIGQTEGTIVYKIGSSLIYNATFIELHKNSVQNRIAIYTQPNGNLSFIFRNAGSYSSITNSSTQALADGTVVLKYSASGAKLFYGGAVIASDDTIVVPETDVLTLGSESSNALFSGQCKNAIIYETAISDSEAIELTTL